MAGRYADLSTEELDRLIELEERRLGRERGAAKRRHQRCARVPPARAPLHGIALPSEACYVLLNCAVLHAGHIRSGEPGKRCGPAVCQAYARKNS
jgi:hypothetical protein